MATLQTLRNKGPLLIIFVGLALLAFIAGDAFKMFESNSHETNVGKVGEEEVSIQEFNELDQMYSIYCKVLSNSFGIKEKSEEERRNDVWNMLNEEKLVNDYAKELGLEVTAEEINYVLANKPELHAGLITDRCLFVNQTGVFDANMLGSFLEQYDQAKNEGETNEDLEMLHTYWKFLERSIKLRMTELKIANLYSITSIVNPAVAEKDFRLGNDSIIADVASFPVFAIDTMKVSDEEIADYYNKNIRYKKDWHNTEETRTIKAVRFIVEPSDEDNENTRLAMQECADTLKAGYDNYSRLARFTQSENISYQTYLAESELNTGITTRTINGTQEIVMTPLNGALKSRVTESAKDEVIEPQEVGGYYYVIKNLEMQSVPKEFTINFAIITHESKETLAATVDTLVSKLNKGGDFIELTKGYEMKHDTVTFEPAKFLTYGINAQNAQIRNGFQGNLPENIMATARLASAMSSDSTQLAIYNASTEGYQSVEIPNTNSKIVFKVIEKKDTEMVYKPLIMRRQIKFSEKTYNNELTRFNKFVASCKSIADINHNARENGYYVEDIPAVNKLAVNICEDKNAKMIKWLFDENTEVGSLSEVFKCNNNMFMVVALENINHRGYMPLTQSVGNGATLYDFIKSEVQKEKAFAKVIEEVKGMSDEAIAAASTSIDKIEYNQPTYINGHPEPLVSAVAARLNEGEKSEPFKGDNGVYVVKVTKRINKEGKLDMKQEHIKAKMYSNPGNIFNVLNDNNPATTNFHKF